MKVIITENQLFIFRRIQDFIDIVEKQIKGYEKQNYLLNCYKEANTKENYMCKTFMNEKNIENILIPRYNQWIKMNEFE